MATGDITAVRINAEGWYAEVDISGLDVGGTYDFNLGTNNDPSACRMVLTVTSEGYDATGTLGTMTRTVYGTNYKRKVYPDNASADEAEASGTVTLKIALSDWVYNDDTSITCTIGAGLYTESATPNNAASSVSVTNNSTEDYPKVIANWSWPGWDLIEGSSFTLRCVAFHRSARDGQPVKCVKFSATDEHSNTVTATATAATIDSSMPDAVPVIEYVGTLSTSSLTQGDLITCNFIAYPHYGDADSILNTGDGVNTMPTPLYAPQYRLCDKTGEYGRTVAVVNPTTGDDGTGDCVDLASFNSGSPPDKYATIAAAATAIAAYNNTNRSRNNTGGGIIYLDEGTHVWTGGTVSAGGQATAEAYCLVTKYPGATRDNVIIGSASGTKQINERLKLSGIKITNSTTAGFLGMDYVWMHDCILASTGAATFYTNACTYFTQSRIGNSDEYKQYSTGNNPRCIIRGCESFEGIARQFMPYVFIGNKINSSTTGTMISTYIASMTIPAMNNIVIAYNNIKRSADGIVFDSASISESAQNICVTQNVFEKSSAAGSNAILKIAGDGSAVAAINNILVFCNTVLGQRANLAYNDYNLAETGPGPRKSWFILGNVFDDLNVVTDIDAHGGTADGDRSGNHGIIHGCGLIGNVILNRVGTTSYEPKFGGLLFKRDAPLAPNFVDDNTNIGGDGDYRPTASSPFRNFIPAGLAVLPYDIAGRARRNDGAGTAGAYEYMNIPVLMRAQKQRRSK